MRFSRHAFACAILSVFFLSPGDAEAQTAVTYRFLEVVDAAGKPVAEATVEQIPRNSPPQKTDANGVLENFPVYSGDFNTSGLRVIKAGYITHDEMDLRDENRHRELLQGEVPGYDPLKVKVVLLKEPVTAAERAAVEAEQRGREFLLAVKRADVANVERLLRAGASAETKDAHGIPAVLFAAANGDLKTIQALLKAGAEVRNKSRPGRKALLYYMGSLGKTCAADAELVQTLIAAGADVNAARQDGETVLSIAAWCVNSPVAKLLERAGARRK